VVRQPLTERARDSWRLRALDLRDRVSGRADRLVPPRRLDFAGHADFIAGGDELLSHAVGLAGLQPGDAVLDVGCGTGRVARPLAGFLGAHGSYDGFDTNREAIGWCRRRYRSAPHFRFTVADAHHQRHNPHGLHTAADYPFPYEDGRFDVAILASVLTRLLESEADHFLAETARVLKPGGRMLATLFVLDDASRAGISAGRSGLPFLDPEGHVAVISEDVPEEAVAYDARWVRERLDAHGLRLREPMQPGTWGGREDGVSLQDVVVAERA
jgi:SAM-dependent methyltransferase